jgi:hypothetical protein
MDWTHIHLAISHLPVIGIPFCLLMIFLGWVRARRDVVALGLWLLLFTCAAGVGVKVTGDEAADAVKGIQRFETRFIESHEESADQATTGIFVLLLAAALALFLGRGGQRYHRAMIFTLLVIGALTCFLLARTANLGGHIAHPEIRAS